MRGTGAARAATGRRVQAEPAAIPSAICAAALTAVRERMLLREHTELPEPTAWPEPTVLQGCTELPEPMEARGRPTCSAAGISLARTAAPVAAAPAAATWTAVRRRRATPCAAASERSAESWAPKTATSCWRGTRRPAFLLCKGRPGWTASAGRGRYASSSARVAMPAGSAAAAAPAASCTAAIRAPAASHSATATSSNAPAMWWSATRLALEGAKGQLDSGKPSPLGGETRQGSTVPGCLSCPAPALALARKRDGRGAGHVKTGRGVPSQQELLSFGARIGHPPQGESPLCCMRQDQRYLHVDAVTLESAP